MSRPVRLRGPARPSACAGNTSHRILENDCAQRASGRLIVGISGRRIHRAAKSWVRGGRRSSGPPYQATHQVLAIKGEAEGRHILNSSGRICRSAVSMIISTISPPAGRINDSNSDSGPEIPTRR